jgi:hypothetical protein
VIVNSRRRKEVDCFAAYLVRGRVRVRVRLRVGVRVRVGVRAS